MFWYMLMSDRYFFISWLVLCVLCCSNLYMDLYLVMNASVIVCSYFSENSLKLAKNMGVQLYLIFFPPMTDTSYSSCGMDLMMDCISGLRNMFWHSSNMTIPSVDIAPFSNFLVVVLLMVARNGDSQ